jgi:hypothetical protein
MGECGIGNDREALRDLGLPCSALLFIRRPKPLLSPFLGVNFVNLAEQTSNTPSPPFVQMGLTPYEWYV